MNVYILRDHSDYDYEEIHGVFATQAAARKATPSDPWGLRWEWQRIAEDEWRTLPLNFTYQGFKILRYEVQGIKALKEGR